MSEPGLKCVWRGEAFKKGGGWLSSAYKKRYFCVEKVQAEGAPEKFYGMRVLKYYKDKAAYEADPKKFKGAIRCSISTKMTVEKPKTSAELGGEEKQIFCLSFQREQDKMAKAGASRYAGDSRKMEIACESKTVVKQFVDSLLGLCPECHKQGRDDKGCGFCEKDHALAKGMPEVEIDLFAEKKGGKSKEEKKQSFDKKKEKKKKFKEAGGFSGG